MCDELFGVSLGAAAPQCPSSTVGLKGTHREPLQEPMDNCASPQCAAWRTENKRAQAVLA